MGQPPSPIEFLRVTDSFPTPLFFPYKPVHSPSVWAGCVAAGAGGGRVRRGVRLLRLAPPLRRPHR